MFGLIKGKEVHFDEEYLHVKLEDNRIISTPIDWYKPLKQATIAQLKNYKLICQKSGIEWEELDYHLSIENMLEITHLSYIYPKIADTYPTTRLSSLVTSALVR